MSAQDNLSGHQFGYDDALRATGRSIVRMRPSELLPYADEIPHDRSEVPEAQNRDIDALGAGIQRTGYRAKSLRLEEHIHLIRTDNIESLGNGNHRVHAMTRVGYDKPVPVVLSDRRTHPGS